MVGIHLPGVVGVSRNLPAGEIDGLEAALDLLDRLIAGHSPQAANKGALRHKLAQALCAEAGERVFDADRAGQAIHFFGLVITGDGRVVGGVHRLTPFVNFRSNSFLIADTNITSQTLNWQYLYDFHEEIQKISN